MTADALNDLAAQHVGRPQGDVRAPCPLCAKPGRDDAVNITVKTDGSVVAHCHRCGQNGVARAPNRLNGARSPAARARPKRSTDSYKTLWESGADPGEACEHPYLLRKQVNAHGVRVTGELLLVPLRNVTGDLVGVERIWPSGTKKHAAGTRKTGGFHVIGTPDKDIIVAEGYATAASIYEATVTATAVAFDADNLLHVAKALHEKHPTSTIIIAADDDAGTAGNPGLTKATAAARAVGGLLAVPDFGADRREGLTDFNDLAKYFGHEAVRKCVDQAKAREVTVEESIAPTDFYSILPQHKYLYVPTRDLWPAESIVGRLGSNVRKELDLQRAAVQMTWHPSEPLIINNRIVADGGWVDHPGVRVVNLYRSPNSINGDPTQAGPWRDHLRFIYHDEAEHIERWLAQRVQRPGEKVNHALVLGGAQGIGKDTVLEPVKYGVGPWNWQEISPSQMLGRFNGWAKSVVARVSEARDLGDVDRFAFYDHSKVYIAAPPDVIRVDEKNLREHLVFNVLGVIVTTNHKTDGIYLPSDDRRHFVAWSERCKDDFGPAYWSAIWHWYEAGGYAHVVAFLRELDISTFDAKAPPPKTAAWYSIVASGSAPEDAEIRDVIEQASEPDALTLDLVIGAARDLSLHDLADELRDRKGRRSLPHRMERAGYVPVRNPNADDGLFKIGGRRQAVYAKRTLTTADQIRAARRVTGTPT